MTVRQFRPIAPVDFRTTGELTRQAGRQFGAGFEALRGAVGDLRKTGEAKRTFETEGNDATIQANLEKFQSLGELRQAKKAGTFDLTALQRQFGGQYSPAAVKTGLKATEARLKNAAIDTATGSAIEAAESAQDITTGQKAFADSLRTQNVSEQDILKESAKFSDQATALKDRFARNKEATFEDAMSQFQTASTTTGVTTAEARAEISKNLPPDLSRRFTKESKEWESVQSALTPNQKAEVDYLNQRDRDAINIAQQRGDSEIGAAQANLDRTPAPISQEVSAHFADVADPGGSVIDWFKDKLDPGIGTSGAVEDISNKYREMISSDINLSDGSKLKLSDREAAALLVESWQATYGEQQNTLTADLNMDVLNEEVKRRAQAYANRNKRQAAIGAAKIKHDAKMLSLRTTSRDSLFDYGKGLRKSNVTGKPIKPLESLSLPETRPGSNKAILERIRRDAPESEVTAQPQAAPSALKDLLNRVSVDYSPRGGGTFTPEQVEENFQFIKRLQQNR